MCPLPWWKWKTVIVLFTASTPQCVWYFAPPSPIDGQHCSIKLPLTVTKSNTVVFPWLYTRSLFLLHSLGRYISFYSLSDCQTGHDKKLSFYHIEIFTFGTSLLTFMSMQTVGWKPVQQCLIEQSIFKIIPFLIVGGYVKITNFLPHNLSVRSVTVVIKAWKKTCKMVLLQDKSQAWDINARN